MRNPLLLLGLIALLVLVGCGEDATDGDGAADDGPIEGPPTVSKTWRGEGNLLEFSAWEMGCGGCESTIQKRVSGLDGVVSVEADMDSSVVRVGLAEGTDRATLVAQITEALELPESGKVFEIVRAGTDP